MILARPAVAHGLCVVEGCASRCAALLSFLMLSWAVPAGARDVTPRGPLAPSEQAMVALFEAASPSVAYITTEVIRSAGIFGAEVAHGAGSGFVWDASGHIVTNNHVVEGATRVFVQLDAGEAIEARVVGASPEYDLAVVKLLHPPRGLRPIDIGSSADLKIGQAVYAIGNPFGLQRTLTHGIVSALDRQLPTSYEREIAGVIQTDAAINPGNSGGPLVNMRGEVIGINSAIATSIGQFAGVGFAIPINMVRDILPTLVKGEKVTRGMLGVGIKEVTASVAKEFGLSEAKGALVVRVYADSPAAKGGVKLGDVIVRYDGKEVDNTELLREMVGATAPGKEVKLVVIRDGKEETLRVTVAKMTPQMSAAMMPSEEGASALGKLGMSVQTLTPDLAKEFGLQATEGAIITDVQEGSPASLAELERGDLIVEADHQKVANADDLEEALNKAKDKEDVWLRIKRKDAELLVELHVK